MGDACEDEPPAIKAIECSSNKDDGREEEVEEGKPFIGPSQYMKSSTVAVANFSRLKPHTDLRQPPPNWLRGKKYFKVPKSWLKSESTKFSSLWMADTFPETVTDVNVITAAENIKKLLKMPFSKSQISMAVHRIGKTLLIDELDIYRHFGKPHQSNDLDWFYTFIRNILLDDGKSYKSRKKHKVNSQNWNLLSKFLYHSIGQCDQDALELQQPPPTSHEPTECDFARQVLWTFEDISMLLATDLPIFGGGKFPAVSLRLRDANSPINVLTGIDYWLDNLMCNVPELAMCYHLDGIVQKYEILKTEEIPHISEAQFSPKVVKDVAQNILSFIKSNCTQEGHTYWLFKGSNEDVIKLYDLSSLSTDSTERGKNPFVMPVALLLYRVARNMSVSEPSKRNRNAICKLLENCISLLEETGHSNTELMAAACYLLGHMYLSKVRINEDEEDENEEDSIAEICHSGIREAIKPTSEVDVRRLIYPGEMVNHLMECPTREATPQEELANIAVDYIVKGLRSIENYEPANVSLNCQAIPLKYKSDTKERSKLSDNQSICTKSFGSSVARESWQQKYKHSLLQDSVSSFSMQAKHALEVRHYGRALRQAHIALACLESILGSTCCDDIGDGKQVIGDILDICGDAHLLMTVDVHQHQQEFNKKCENEVKILEHTSKEVGMQDLSWAVQFCSERKDCLGIAYRCYETILDQYGKGRDSNFLMTATRKLGSARNELGIWFMNAVTEIRQKGGLLLGEEQKLWSESLQCFERAVKAFKAVEDTANIALLNNNMGRLMRLCAQAFMLTGSEGDTGEFNQEEKHYLNKAVDYYQAAKSALGSRAKNPGIWDAVTWELSSTYFTMATMLQDHAPLSRMSREEVEKEVLHLMHRVLLTTEKVEPSHNNAVLYQFRTANVYHRLGSMYHNSYRNQTNDQKRRYTRSLADLNYEKAEKLFRSLERYTELLRVQLERVAMVEHQYLGQTGTIMKIKSLQTALEILFQCKETIKKSNESTLSSKVSGSCHKSLFPTVEALSSKEPDSFIDLLIDPILVSPGEPPEGCQTGEDIVQEHIPLLTSISGETEVVVTDLLLVQSDVESVIKNEHLTETSTTENNQNPTGAETTLPSTSGNVNDDLDAEEDTEEDADDAETNRLMGILQSRLQYMLLHLVKTHSSVKRKNIDTCSKYKQMYAISLRLGLPVNLDTLLQSLTEIRAMYNNMQQGHTAKQ